MLTEELVGHSLATDGDNLRGVATADVAASVVHLPATVLLVGRRGLAVETVDGALAADVTLAVIDDEVGRASVDLEGENLGRGTVGQRWNGGWSSAAYVPNGDVDGVDAVKTKVGGSDGGAGALGDGEGDGLDVANRRCRDGDDEEGDGEEHVESIEGQKTVSER